MKTMTSPDPITTADADALRFQNAPGIGAPAAMDAIVRSIRENRTVRIPYDPDSWITLIAEGDETGSWLDDRYQLITRYQGTTPSGSEWSVALVGED